MNKAEYIKKYSEEAYSKILQRSRERSRDFHTQYPEESLRRIQNWKVKNPEKVKVNNQEISHKGGKYYESALKYRTMGIPGEKNAIRCKHRAQYTPYKKIIDPEGLTQIHHEWLLDTADYRGIALVEANQHMHGYIDAIQILEGEITLLTEKGNKREIK